MKRHTMKTMKAVLITALAIAALFMGDSAKILYSTSESATQNSYVAIDCSCNSEDNSLDEGFSLDCVCLERPILQD